MHALMAEDLATKQFVVASLPVTYFGAGCIGKLPDVVLGTGCNVALIVTDRALEDTPVVARVLAALKAKRIKTAMFTDVRPNPTTDNVAAGADAAGTMARKSMRVAVVAVGGGSVIDASKGIAIAAVNPERGRDLDYRNDFANPSLPLIAIPTTAGTGAECNAFGVITDPKAGQKFYVGGALPAAAILDPELTLSLPPGPTAATGMDALIHCLESIMSRNSNPRSAGIAMQAIRMITANLPRSFDDGNDLEARSQMLLAAHMAAEAMATTGLGLCHAIAHALGGRYDIAHGVALTMVLPGVLRFNGPSCKERLTEVDIEAILALPARLGMTKRLSDFGITAEEFSAIITDALNDEVMNNTPIMPTRSDITGILAGAL